MSKSISAASSSRVERFLVRRGPFKDPFLGGGGKYVTLPAQADVTPRAGQRPRLPKPGLLTVGEAPAGQGDTFEAMTAWGKQVFPVGKALKITLTVPKGRGPDRLHQDVAAWVDHLQNRLCLSELTGKAVRELYRRRRRRNKARRERPRK